MKKVNVDYDKFWEGVRRTSSFRKNDWKYDVNALLAKCTCLSKAEVIQLRTTWTATEEIVERIATALNVPAAELIRDGAPLVEGAA